MNETEQKYAWLEDPGIRDFLIAGERFYPPDAVSFTMAEQRVFYDRYCAHFRKTRPAGVTATDVAHGGVPCRHYRPDGAAGAPLLLYLHGGGFVVGGLDSHDDICAELCEGARIDVVAVDYRLAPEHPFPAAFEDCWAVLKAVASVNAEIIVGGDSAGGNLAAALALKARDEQAPRLKGQVLIYPGLGGDMSKGSYVVQAHAPGLSTADVQYYRDTYKGGDTKFAEPLRETDYRGLPPAFLVAAGLDPLHDDCFDYAARLRAAGVEAQVRDEPLLVHAFLRARNMSAPARRSFDAIIAACASLAHSGRLPPGRI
ncbi:alpha/beta hydrolase [Aestuariivirga sp.]|uniref:alpha/beta hydrolase n=1 Tax=Aestuariivirga sp. TaxID=2650926 RepID=UPI0025C3BC12|nr:alpha/beta hydrolase [Aestuariivirga sp.]